MFSVYTMEQEVSLQRDVQKGEDMYDHMVPYR
jgi:hypothetical protein